ncbi:unnamed protein product [Protopolystoma xenopodis]|uniref:Uncharacterized protein n=1 Tax=Protopolystoma xenopodis TaxID=117903 RepID=A0A448WXL9_9PLAT|nr:unnamed protein product [Protopolystoma xenopodis]
MEGSGKMLVIAVGPNSQAGIIFALLGAADGDPTAAAAVAAADGVMPEAGKAGKKGGKKGVKKGSTRQMKKPIKDSATKNKSGNKENMGEASSEHLCTAIF